MKAKVFKTFRGVPDGEIYPREFVAGDEVDGELAIAAINGGMARAITPQKPIEHRAHTSPAAGGTPDNFPGLARANGGNSSERAEPNAGKRRGRPKKM